MKRVILLCVLVLCISRIFALQQDITFASNAQSVRVLDSHPERLLLHYNVSMLNISETTTTDGVFTKLTIDGFIGNNDVGNPELPFLGSLITVPINASLRVNYISSKTSEISLQQRGFANPVYPAQPSYTKSTDLSLVQFEHNAQTYMLADYQGDYSPFSYNEVGFARGYRVFEVGFSPIRYNPVENTIFIYENLTVEVYFDNADLSETEYQKARTWSADFEGVFQGIFLNYTPPTTRDTLMKYPTKYLIICHPPFADAMQPFVEWKTQQGFDIIFVTTDVTGTTTTSIKAYLQNIWDSATPQDPAPTYLLIVGDTGQIPANPYTVRPNGLPDAHVTDLTYVKLQGNDYLNEMYYGRFSANNLTELQPYIDKTLMYEKYTMPDPTYLQRSLMIAGVESSGGLAQQYCNSAVNYVISQYIKEDSQYHIYNAPYAYFHPSSGSYAATIRSQVSAGVGWANYSAHGDKDRWYEPQFTNAQVNQLTNEGMYPVVIGNACLTNFFNAQTSFSEAWLRAPNKGGVLYIGATNSTYWAEDWHWAVGYKSAPASGNGATYNASTLGMYDRLFHTHGEDPAGWNISAGAMIYIGNAVVQSTTSSYKAYYWEIYSMMGDPSLIPYLGLPTENTPQYMPQLFVGAEELEFTDCAPFSRIAISLDNELYGSVVADENGDALLTFAPITEPGEVMLVITAQNKEPIITSIQVLTSNTPYILFSAVTNPQSGTNFVEFDAEAELDITVRNVGPVAAEGVTFSLTSLTDAVTVESGVVQGATIAGGTTFTIPTSFTIRVSGNVTDQAVLPLRLTATTADDQWVMNCSVKVNAPKLELTAMQIKNDLGVLVNYYNPGDTGEVALTFKNTGHLQSRSGNLFVASSSGDMLVQITNNELPAVNIDASVNFTVNITIEDNVPLGNLAPLSYLLVADIQTFIDVLYVPVGQIVEGFESGDFSALNWNVGTVRPWIVDTSAASIGTYAAHSAANVPNNQSSSLQITWPMQSAGTIKFDYRVSSENNYDFLTFSINDSDIEQWSGTNITTFRTATYPVPAGANNIFKWTYSKDVSSSSGQDRGWIDNIIFPPRQHEGGQNTPLAQITIDALNIGSVEAFTEISYDFFIANLGNATLTGTITMPNGLTLGGSANYSISAHSANSFTASFYCETVGNYNGNIVITSNDPNHPTFTIPVNADVTPNYETDMPIIPLANTLYANYPNPFNPTTNISFEVKERGVISIDIFNVKGQKVRTLQNGVLNSGIYNIVWNGEDESQRNVGSGVYFYRMQTGEFTAIRKMLLLK